MKLFKYFIIGVIFGVVTFVVGRWIYFDKQPEQPPAEMSAQPSLPPQTGYISESNPDMEPDRHEIVEEVRRHRGNAITQAIESAVPAVVGINVTQVREYVSRNPFWDDPFFRDIFPPRVYRQKVQNLGSGFIISPDGYLVTNEHVVHGATEILVTTTGGHEFQATLVGSDPYTDVALLKIDGENFPYLPFGDSDDVIMGEWAIAIGNPFGLFDINDTPSVTVGVISATDRDFERTREGRIYSDMLQTDASINRGNSGGPLVNSMGEVIGMNTIIFSEGGGSLGVGFAVPINRVRQIIDDLQGTGMVNRNYWIGLSVQNINRLLAMTLGMESSRGVIISEIDPGSPAEKAGLEVGDVIVEMGGYPVQNYQSIHSILDRVDLRVGNWLIMEVFRDGKTLDIKLLLEEVPGS